MGENPKWLNPKNQHKKDLERWSVPEEYGDISEVFVTKNQAMESFGVDLTGLVNAVNAQDQRFKNESHRMDADFQNYPFMIDFIEKRLKRKIEITQDGAAGANTISPKLSYGAFAHEVISSYERAMRHQGLIV